jgi:hypothetical protein
MSNVTADSGTSAIAVLGGGNVTITPSSPTALQGLAGSAQDDRGLGHYGGDQGALIPSTASGMYGLSVQQGSKLTISAVKGAVVTNGILMDSTSTLDLTNNALVVNYNSFWNYDDQAYDNHDDSTGPALVTAVKAASDGGLWDKPGVTSSLASFAAGTTVGVIDNGNGLATHQISSVRGVTLTGTSAAAMYTWYGDANLDGVVNGTDEGMIAPDGTVIADAGTSTSDLSPTGGPYTSITLAAGLPEGILSGTSITLVSGANTQHVILAANANPGDTTLTVNSFTPTVDYAPGSTVQSATYDDNWADGDFNYDGVVNADDWSLFLLGLGESGGANISSVPEPSAALMLVGLGALGIRRRRKA